MAAVGSMVNWSVGMGKGEHGMEWQVWGRGV
jgi:hypothetical protein